MRRTKERNERDFASSLFEFYGLKAVVEIREMVTIQKDVVERKPGWPESSCTPAVLNEAFCGVFSGDEKIGNPDHSAGFEHAISVVDGCEPVGNHRHRVRQRDDICKPFFGGE